MNRGTWKKFERRVAALLGGERVPITGRARGSAPDVAHPLYAIECKLTSRVPSFIDRAMSQAKASARDGQIPVVVHGVKGRDLGRAYVVLELSDFAAWFGGPNGAST